MLKKVLLGALVTAVLLIAIESASRVLYSIRTDMREEEPQWFVLSPDLGWTRRPNFRGGVGGYDREFDAEGYFKIDSRPTDPSARKVMFLGDSNTFGWGAPTPDVFAEYLPTLLPDVAPVDLGVVGASSYQGRVALAKYLPILKPSVVVVSYNFNDRRYVPSPDDIDSAEAFERQWRRTVGIPGAISTVLTFSKTTRIMRSAMERSGIVVEVPKQIDVSKVVPRVTEENYRRNLEEIARQTSQNHIPLVFILLKDNPLETDFLNRGIEKLSSGDPAGAAVILSKAVVRDNTFSDLARLYLSKALRAVGRNEEAEKVLISPMLRDMTGGRPVRLDRDYNRIMEEVAAQYGVAIVDPRKAIDEEPGDYVDFCHFNAGAHHKVATLLAQQLSQLQAHK